MAPKSAPSCLNKGVKTPLDAPRTPSDFSFLSTALPEHPGTPPGPLRDPSGTPSGLLRDPSGTLPEAFRHASGTPPFPAQTLADHLLRAASLPRSGPAAFSAQHVGPLLPRRHISVPGPRDNRRRCQVHRSTSTFSRSNKSCFELVSSLPSSVAVSSYIVFFNNLSLFCLWVPFRRCHHLRHTAARCHHLRHTAARDHVLWPAALFEPRAGLLGPGALGLHGPGRAPSHGPSRPVGGSLGLLGPGSRVHRPSARRAPSRGP